MSDPSVTTPRRIIVGISGASGVTHGIRLLEVLRNVPDVETHLVISNAGKQTIALETDQSVATVEALADHTYRSGDIAAPLSSGSFQTSAMVVIPCAIKTLSGIANCYTDSYHAHRYSFPNAYRYSHP